MSDEEDVPIAADTSAAIKFERINWAFFDRKGHCNAYATSPCGRFVVGVQKEQANDVMEEGIVPHLVVVWDTVLQKQAHRYMLPFGVVSLSSLPLGGLCRLYILAAAHLNRLFLLDICTGQLREISLPRSPTLEHSYLEDSNWHLEDGNSAAASCSGQYQKLSTYWAQLMLQSRQEEVSAALAAATNRAPTPSTSAFLVLHRSLMLKTESNNADADGESSTLYLVSHRCSGGPVEAEFLWMIGVAGDASSPACGANIIDSVGFSVQDSAALDLPCRVQGLGLRDGQIHVIGENKEVLVFDTHSSRLTAVSAGSAGSTTDSPRAPLPRYLDYHNAAVFIIHKPVGCVSSAVDYETCPRGTVYEHAGRAGYPTNMGLVGRLDGDTSGIMVFTNDGLLHDRIIRPPQELRGVALPARLLSGYDQLLLSGAKTVLDLYKTKEYILSVLQGRNSYCLSAEGAFDVARFEEEFGKPLVFNRCNSEYSVKEAQIKVLRRRQVPEHNKHGRADMGWVIDVLVTIREGKHKQIRRLAKRAGYHVVGLQRTMICGGILRLDSIAAPGTCRWLAAEEKRELYEAFNLL